MEADSPGTPGVIQCGHIQNREPTLSHLRVEGSGFVACFWNIGEWEKPEFQSGSVL